MHLKQASFLSRQWGDPQYAYSLHYIYPVTSITMIKKHPLTGVGLGTYDMHTKENIDWKWLRSSFSYELYPKSVKAVESKTLTFDPHSVFLGIFAETGLIGFLGLLYFFLRYARLLITRFKRSKDSRIEKIMTGCILAGFIGFLLNGLITDILSMRHFWIIMAIGLASKSFQKSEGSIIDKR